MLDAMTKWRLKMGVAVLLDTADCAFRVPILGSGAELLFAGAGVALWGRAGWWMLAELAEVTEQIDGFVPTCCLIGMKCKPSIPTPSAPTSTEASGLPVIAA